MHRVRTSTRALSVVAGATMALALTLPAFANTGHQSSWGIPWDDEAFLGSEDECAAAGLDADETLWHFIQTKAPADAAAGMLTAAFDQAGARTAESYKVSGAVLHWAIITGQDTLLTFSSDVTSDGQLNLSHICAGPDGEAASDDATTPPGDDATTPPADDATTPPGDDATTPPGDDATTPPADDGGAVATPRVTPPPTDALGADTSGSSTGWLLAVVGLTALVAALVVGMPSRRRSR